MKTNIALCLTVAALAVTPLGRAQTPPADTNTNTSKTILLTVAGQVEVTRPANPNWVVARTNQVLEAGTRLRTGLRSRATIRLSDLSVLRVNELSTLEIRPTAGTGKTALLELKAGSTYLFNREKPTDLEFRTPVASGAIRGTEFHLAVNEADGRTVLSLLDGAVALENPQGRAEVRSGEEAVIEAGQAPRKTALLEARNVIQWNLYYPGVLDADEAGLSDAEKSALDVSLRAYRSGDVLAAVAAYPAGRAPGSDAEKIYFAALALAAGQVAQTESALNGVISPLAGALRQVIATVKDFKAQSSKLKSSEATTATEWLAESYAQQARSQLAAALQAARAATAKSPQFGFAWVRVAELEFSFSHNREAMHALARGLELSPRNAPARTLQGFVLAAMNQTAKAQAAFDEAIALDGALANAWLGRGLCRIRHGDAVGGRQDLQVAATVEPNRAVLRSYLGKAFSNARDNQRAAKELELARTLDPNDPTSWLYSALLLQQQNRANEAIRDLERSKELNDHRALYRSKLLIEQDRAVRSANLAAIYRDAGMVELSAREATRAVNADYANYSAHRFLANSYDALRDPKLINLRYETPWFSELLVANLLAPVGAGSLSQNISQQEYSRFFDGNHFGVSSSTEYYSHGDWVQRASQYGTLGNSSYALDALYRSERGWRANNDLEQLAFDARFKQQFTPDDSLFLEVQTLDARSGDLAQYYNQGDASTIQRVRERQEPNAFAGWHHQWAPGSHTLFLAGRLNDTLDYSGSLVGFSALRDSSGQIIGGFRTGYLTDYRTEFTAYAGELQHIWQRDAHTVVVGGRYQAGEADHTVTLPTAQQLESDLRRLSAYGYYYWRVAEPLLLQAGVSYDKLDYPENVSLVPFTTKSVNQDKVSPKAGFYYTPLAGTTLRGSYSRSLGGVFYDGSVRLEPTQLGGFNQAFRSVIPESVVGLVPGTAFETFGLAVDQKFGQGTYVSVAGEVLQSRADRAVGVYTLTFGPPEATSTSESLRFRERSVAVTVNQLLGKHWSAGATYRLTDADLQEQFGELTPALRATADRDVAATLHQVNLFVLVQLPCGFFAGGNTLWSKQSNRGYSPELPGDNFWQQNVYAGYRFWQRRAELKLALLNVSDQDYQLNPLTLYHELPRERTLLASLKFYF